MDNNLINIDDLVRQRMLSREEEERGGAWLRMSELLEEEMPKVRGAIPWRRIFGGLSVLLLISALSVGGYELNAHRKLGDATVPAAIPGSAIVSANDNANAPLATGAVAENGDMSKKSPDNNAPGNDNNNNTPITANVNQTNDNQSDKHIHRNTTTSNSEINNTDPIATTASGNVVSANNDQPGNKATSGPRVQKTKVIGSNRTANGNSLTENAKQVNGDGAVVKKTSRKGGRKMINSSANTTDIKTQGNENTVAVTGSPVGVGHKTLSSKKVGNDPHTLAVAGTPGAVGSKTLRSKKPSNDHTIAVAGNAGTKGSKTQRVRKTHKDGALAIGGNAGTMGSNKVSGPKAGKSGTTGVGGDNSRKAVTKNKRTLKGANGALALSSAPKTINGKTSGTTGVSGSLASKSGLRKAPSTKAVLNSHPSVSNIKKTTDKIASKNKKNKPVAAMVKTKTKKSLTASVSKPDNSTTGSNGTTKDIALATDNAGTTTGSDDETASVTTKKEKRVIRTLIVHEPLTYSTKNPSRNHVDTISFADVIEYFDLPSALKPDAHNSARKTGNELGSNNGSANDNTAVKTNQQENSLAAAPVTKKSSSSETETTSEKNNSGAKKSNGAKAMENLSAAFNDIKYQAGNAQFAAGLTGGLNGTFLGPNSFKGFQFGITGKLMFSDVLVLMGELKYFQRANSNYTLNDNYYTYTPVAGGYNKILVENPYGIPALHSLELPITMRYCINKFNFFAGGNVVYDFAINAGDYPTPVTSSANFVATMGNDNEPKIKPGDFNSKFGLGYIFGASLAVSNKVTFDFRDVQTFWDNSSSVGSKYISSQLYKSPSFQLSMDYTFGGKKKNKE